MITGGFFITTVKPVSFSKNVSNLQGINVVPRIEILTNRIIDPTHILFNSATQSRSMRQVIPIHSNYFHAQYPPNILIPMQQRKEEKADGHTRQEWFDIYTKENGFDEVAANFAIDIAFGKRESDVVIHKPVKKK